MGVRGHKHEWYVISFDERTRKPALYACAVEWACIATAKPELKGRGKNRMLVNPSPVVPVPRRGMWSLTDKEPDFDKAKQSRGREPVSRRTVRPDDDRGHLASGPRHPAQAAGPRPSTPPTQPRPDQPAPVMDADDQQLPTLHPWAD